MSHRRRIQIKRPLFIPSLDFSQLEGLNLPNLTVEPLLLEIISEEPLPEGEEIPPIPGIVVIPGNVAYLNQFFSVLLSVSMRSKPVAFFVPPTETEPTL